MATNQAHSHKNQNNINGHGFVFYASDKFKIPKPEFQDYQWKKYQDKLDELVKMNHVELKTAYEIQAETGVYVKDLDQLFEANNVEVFKHKKISALKRNKDFEIIYDLHINQKLSLNEIYRNYRYSPLYSKRVLKDKGIDHLGFVNQLK
ncbi:AraC family transcriptional regulator [Virgibacillus oceani]